MSVTRRGAELPRTPEVMALVRKELVVTPFTLAPFPKSFKVYVDAPGASSVLVPLFWARRHFPRLVDARSPGLCLPEGVRFHGALDPRLRQPEAVDAVMRSLRDTGGAMLSLATGYGKTTCAVYIACALRTKTLVVVHKEFLATQWEERVRAHVPGARVSRIQAGRCDTSGDFVVAMLQTLVSRGYPPFDEFGLVVVDEAHHVSAPGFCRAMWSLCAPHTLALTATPDRLDGLGRVVNWFMGDVAFRAARTNAASTLVRISRFRCAAYSLPPPTNARGDVCFTSVVTHLAQNEERTRALVGLVVGLAADREVLVLSHRRAHCTRICEAVREAGVECATYLGGDPCVPSARVLVATYTLTNEGFDCPRLTALVLATPMSNVEQACGRVMRGASGAGGAVIVDVVDVWGVCIAQSAKRKAFYKASGFTVEVDADPPEACAFMGTAPTPS